MVVERTKPPQVTSLEDMPRLLDWQSLQFDDLNVRAEAQLKVLTEIRQNMEQAPEGVSCSITKEVTGNLPIRVRLRDEPDAGHRPWCSATITNDEDSVSDAYVQINDQRRPARRLRPSESLKVDFHAPRLEDIYLRCATAADTATVVMDGLY